MKQNEGEVERVARDALIRCRGFLSQWGAGSDAPSQMRLDHEEEIRAINAAIAALAATRPDADPEACGFGWERGARCVEDPGVEPEEYCELCARRAALAAMSKPGPVADEVTPEEAERLYADAKPEPGSEEDIDRLVKHATTPADEGEVERAAKAVVDDLIHTGHMECDDNEQMASAYACAFCAVRDALAAMKPAPVAEVEELAHDLSVAMEADPKYVAHYSEENRGYVWREDQVAGAREAFTVAAREAVSVFAHLSGQEQGRLPPALFMPLAAALVEDAALLAAEQEAKGEGE